MNCASDLQTRLCRRDLLARKLHLLEDFTEVKLLDGHLAAVD